ncbi:hypothetical protein DEV91_13344 [Phyllobacterium brassicacearum]|nr:hypothetical protein DEV91_13344 [Phyllobacterium brassicacearum]
MEADCFQRCRLYKTDDLINVVSQRFHRVICPKRNGEDNLSWLALLQSQDCDASGCTGCDAVIDEDHCAASNIDRDPVSQIQCTATFDFLERFGAFPLKLLFPR